MKKLTLFLIFAALMVGTAIVNAQCDYEDLHPTQKGTITHQNGSSLSYSSPELVFNLDNQGAFRKSTYTPQAAAAAKFEKKAVVTFDYYTTSFYGGTGDGFVLSFRDKDDVALFSLYTNRASSSGATTTAGIAVGTLGANEWPTQAKNLSGLTIASGNVNGTWFNVTAEVDLLERSVTFTVKGFNGSTYNAASATEKLNFPPSYNITTEGIKTIVFYSNRVGGNIYGVSKLTNLCIKNLDATVTPPCVITDFSGVTRNNNGDAQQGWSVNGIMNKISEAKYLVLETEGGNSADGFNGIQFIYQGAGNGVGINWEQPAVIDGWISFSRGAGKTVSIAIDLKNVMGDKYNDFIKCTDWANIMLGYYNFDTGGNAFEGLGLKQAYLTKNIEKPAGAVNLNGGTNFGFIFSGSLVCAPISNAAAITSFTIGTANGTITHPVGATNGTIAITVPAGTNVTALTPTIAVSAGATVSPASGAAQNFTNPVTYTVTAEDGTTTGIYVVTVTVAGSTATIDFENYAVGTVMPSVGWGNATTSTIVLDPAGVKGKSLNMVATNWNSGSRLNKVTLEQGKTLADVAKMKVDIYRPALVDLDWKAVQFWWGAPGTDFNPGTPTGNTDPNQPITNQPRETWLTLEFTAAVMGLKDGLLALRTFDMGIGVNADPNPPYPPLSLYWDNITFIDAAGKVILLGEPSTAAAITSFKIGEINGTITAPVGATNGTIAITVPNGTNVTALTPTIAVSAGATVSPASGVAQNFTNPVTYTVTAEDGTTKGIYVVTVTVEKDKFVDVIKTDLKDLKNASGGAAPAVGATSGTFNATAGQITLMSNVSWMHATQPDLSDNPTSLTDLLAAGEKYIRFGATPTEPIGTLPTTVYLTVKNANVPFVNGGKITALVSSNSLSRTFEVYSVELAARVATINIGVSKKINEVTVDLPSTLNGVHTLRIVRSDSGPFLWGLNITTNVATEPAIELTSGTATQAVNIGQAISSIVYTWGGTATTANVVWTGTANASTPPAGITVTPNTTAKTVTIAGTPTAAGNYAYSITSTDGTAVSTPLTGGINVLAAGRELCGVSLNFGDYHIIENFDGLSAFPSGWSVEAMGTNPTVANGKINFQGSGNGTRGNSVAFPNSGNSEMVYVEFDFFMGTAPVIQTSGNMALFLSLTANTTWNADRIFEFCFPSTGYFHLQNLDLNAIALTGTGSSNGNYTINYTNATSTTTRTSVQYNRTSTYKIKALLDFVNKKVVCIYIDGTKVGENLNFISQTANNAGKFSLINMRTANSTDISTCTLDNFEIGSIPTAPPTEPTLTKTSGANNQSTFLPLNKPIENIVYSYGGTATSATVVWTGTANATTPPAGITVTPNATAKTVTIAGTPTAVGNFGFSVTATDGTKTTEPLTGTIEVKATNKKFLAYVTDPASTIPGDKQFIDALSEFFDVNVVSSSLTGVDFAPYDIIVQSAVPASDQAGLATAELRAKCVTKPFVQMKTFSLQSSRWNWVTGQANVTNTGAVTILDRYHPIFRDVVYSGANEDEIILTEKTSGNLLVGFTGWAGTPSKTPIILAHVKGAANQFCYAEIPVGTVMNGMGTAATQFPQIILGVSEGCWDNITVNTVKIAVNAARYVAGILGDPQPEITDVLYEPFDNVTAPWDFTAASTDITIATLTNSYGKVLQFAQASSQTGKRTNAKTNINWTSPAASLNTDGYVYLEFDWYSGAPTANTGGFIRFLSGASDADAILTIGIQGNTDNILFGNLVPASQVDYAATGIRITPSSGSFLRNQWYHVYACMNFSTKKIVKFRISNSAGNTYEASNVNFINPNATAITRMEVINGRTSSGNGNWPSTQIDNIHVYYAAPIVNYNNFLAYVASIQAMHDAETGTAAFVTAIKATLQTAINTAKSSASAVSKPEQLTAAKATLAAAAAAFDDALAHYTALRTSITSSTASYTAATPRVGTEFLNYKQSALTTLNNAIAAANTAANTALTIAAIDAAKVAIDNARAVFNTTGRVVPLRAPYKIFTYGVDNGDRDNNKKVLYTDGTNLMYKVGSEAANDMWLITQTGANLYTLMNIATGLYVDFTGGNNDNQLPLSATPVAFTVCDGALQGGGIVIDAPYFLYGILTAAGDRALEITGNNLRLRNGYADRGRFAFQFEPVLVDIELQSVTPAKNDTKVKVDADVKVTFNWAINLIDKPNLKAVSLKGVMGVKAELSPAGNEIIISHNDFEPETEYTVIVPKGSIPGYDEEIKWSFTTGKAEFKAAELEVTPENGSKDVAINASVTVTFKKNPYINGEELNWDLVTIEDAAGKAVSGVMVMGQGISGYTFEILHAKFAYNTEYTVKIPKAVVPTMDADFSWKFTTEKSPVGFDTPDAAQVTVIPTITDGIVRITTVGAAHIRLCDLTGRTVEVCNSEGGIYELDLSNQATGVYFAVITTDNKTTVSKIVKK